MVTGQVTQKICFKDEFKNNQFSSGIRGSQAKLKELLNAVYS